MNNIHGNLSTILSTKLLTLPQQELILNAGIGLVHYDVLEIEKSHENLMLNGDAVIITSKNALDAIKKHQIDKPVFCVGEVTAALLSDYQVVFTAQNARELADYLIENQSHLSFDYLCGSHRRDELPELLKSQNINLTEHIAYHSSEVSKSFDRTFARVLFYSPRGVLAFAKANLPPKTAVCIGNTTAAEARKHFKTVLTATKPTVTNTIVTAIKSLKNDQE
ncbi:MAG: uroporphyrinogen-III synthase [Nonlabens sp.]